MKDLQNRVKEWHARKYGAAQIERIGLKLGEEAGEVQRCIDRIIHANTHADAVQWYENLPQEIGDVGMVLLALCNRVGVDFEAVLRERAEEVMARPHSPCSRGEECGCPWRARDTGGCPWQSAAHLPAPNPEAKTGE